MIDRIVIQIYKAQRQGNALTTSLSQRSSQFLDHDFGRPTEGLLGLIVYHGANLGGVLELLKKLSGQHELDVRRVEPQPKLAQTNVTLFARSPVALHPLIAGMSFVSSVVWPNDSDHRETLSNETYPIATVTLNQ